MFPAADALETPAAIVDNPKEELCQRARSGEVGRRSRGTDTCKEFDVATKKKHTHSKERLGLLPDALRGRGLCRRTEEESLSKNVVFYIKGSFGGMNQAPRPPHRARNPLSLRWLLARHFPPRRVMSTRRRRRSRRRPRGCTAAHARAPAKSTTHITHTHTPPTGKGGDRRRSTHGNKK